jgi:hypothetical protein
MFRRLSHLVIVTDVPMQAPASIINSKEIQGSTIPETIQIQAPNAKTAREREIDDENDDQKLPQVRKSRDALKF